MPGIGETLRETRMRRRIDMTEVEASTKIRAKYLRALENEEWDLLPGPTFVKSFLRTYAEYLDLDARRLVEDYRDRYERPTTQELTPLRPVGARRGRRPRRPLLTPGIVLALGVLALLAALWLLGSWGDDGDEQPRRGANTVGSAATTTEAPSSRREDEGAQPSTPQRVRLQIVPTGSVWVCLVDAGGKELIDGQVLMSGDTTREFRSRRFRVTFGTGRARMRTGGRTIDVPDRQEPVGYDLRPGRRPRELAREAQPTCG